MVVDEQTLDERQLFFLLITGVDRTRGKKIRGRSRRLIIFCISFQGGDN